MLLGAILSLIIAIIYILLASLNPTFYMHLYPDVFAFHDRATFFWNNLTLSDLGHNEYQPGALVFFFLVGLSFFVDPSIETFKWGLFIANVILIVLTAGLFHKMGKTGGVILLSVLLIFLGPILLFRFDLLVIFLLTLVFYLWKKGHREVAMMVLAFSVLVKVYPIIFLPYLLFLSFKRHHLRSVVYLLSIFISAAISYFLLYTIVFQISFLDSYVSYNFHNLKSVATESVWASLFYFWNIIQGIPLPKMESAYGINAILRTEVYPSINFYNYFWILPVGFFNIYYFYKTLRRSDEIDYKFVALNLLIFLVFYKVFSNQYWAWFLFLLPLIEIKTLLSRKWIINIFLIILTTILHTYIYPLNYSEWLESLNGGRISMFLVWIMIISSFIMPVLVIRMFYDLFKKDSA